MAKNFILTDSNILRCAPALIEALQREFAAEGRNAEIIEVAPGEASKSLSVLAEIWERLSRGGATRASTLVCAGGGMVTDLGGFAAACFKRGIPHINVSTTLLGAVDASIGGKTGIDFIGLKNEIGAFRMPAEARAAVETFATLPPDQILSGWGEALKTAYIADDKMLRRMLAADPLDLSEERMKEFVAFCREVKMQVVEKDPTEKGLRKILNFGHTAGHAIEAYLLEKGTPIPHGYAVAYGILAALILSHDLRALPSTYITEYTSYLREYYPAPPVTCKDFDRITEIALHDKKNAAPGMLSFVLLDAPGSPVTDIQVSPENLKTALDILINN